VQEGYNESFRGMAAQAAARSFVNGMANGGFATAVHDALRSGFLVREFISYFTDPQETGQKPRCIFNVNLEVTDPSLTAADIEKIKAEMAGIFHAAGQKLVFNDPGAAVGTRNGTYSLTISSRLPEPFE